MALPRLLLRPDGRLGVAALGIAAALALPLVAAVVAADLALEDRSDHGWLLLRADHAPLDPDDVPEPARFLPAVGSAGTQANRTDAQANGTAAGEANGTGPLAAFYETRPAAPQGHLVLPARGVDAYAADGLRSVAATTWLALLAGLPAVGLVAAGFADLEARDRARDAAVFAALGAPRLGRALVIGRVVLALGAGAAAVTASTVVLHLAGVGPFAQDLPWRRLAVVLLLPLLLGLAAGAWAASRRLGTARRLLRAPPDERESPLRVPLPGGMRPLVLGVRVLPVLLLAALLFMVDVGHPLAAAAIPGAIAGGEDEVVRSDGSDLLLGGSVPLAAAQALRHDPAVHETLAEVLVPTTLAGGAVVLRGGAWGPLADFHGLSMRTGAPPGPQEIALGPRLADRLDAAVGDVLLVPAARQADVQALRVSGVLEARGLLADEAVLDTATAQHLAGLPADRASVVRARPDTLDALQAVGRSEGRIEVTGLRLDPPDPLGGQAFTIEVEAVNLGPRPAERLLEARVDGDVAARRALLLDGYGHATVRMVAIAPGRDFTVQVNPEADVAVTGHQARITVPSPGHSDRGPAFWVRADDGTPIGGVRLSVHPDLEAAAAGRDALADGTTGPDGIVRLEPLEEGRYVAAAAGAVAPFRIVAPGLRDTAVLDVEDAWARPAAPGPRDPVHLVLDVRNLGGAPLRQDLEVTRDGALVATVPLRLAPGEQRQVDVPVPAAPGRNVLQVAGREVAFTVATDTAPGAYLPAPEGARPAEAVRRDVADAVLGDARRALAAVGATALVATLAIVVLASDRAVRGRRHVLHVLWAAGEDRGRIRRRAATEGAVMGLGAALLGGLLAKGLFVLLGRLGTPLLFGHAFPDPVDLVFLLQGALAFALACSVAAARAAMNALPRRAAAARALADLRAIQEGR